MEKALSWPLIKTKDVKALQDYSLFLRGCSNAIPMPVNMLAIIRKLSYKFRDKWGTVARELQESHNRRPTFSDTINFIGRQVKILTDSVFGNIQDVHPVTIKKV